jgi:hypothetical protein
MNGSIPDVASATDEFRRALPSISSVKSLTPLGGEMEDP